MRLLYELVGVAVLILLNAFFVAADRFADGPPRFAAAARLRVADVFFFDAPLRGTSIPALRAFESPIAMA